MSFLDWNEDAITNHPTMDKEHKEMLDDVNELYLLLTSEKIENANKLLLKIVNHLKNHFESEERLMKISKTPFYISHKLEHDRFYDKISSLQESISSGNEKLNMEHLKIVKIWFYNHIKFKDKPLAEFLIKHNIK